MNENTLETIPDISSGLLNIIENDLRNLMFQNQLLHGKYEEQRTQIKIESRKQLLDFVEVADAFENLFRSINPRLEGADPQARAWVGNFKTVHRLLQRALKNCGVTVIEVVLGDKANPYWHNVIETTPDPNHENETIIEEIKKGYLYNGEVLRAAEVIAVSNRI